MAVIESRSRYPGLLAKVGQTFNGFLYGDSAPHGSLDRLVQLPWPVRYRLSVSDELRPTELRMLVDSHVDASFYLATKALDIEPQKQRVLLEHGVEQYLHGPVNPPGLRPALDESIAQLPPGTTVKAAKLKQVHRQGFGEWENLYRKAAVAMRDEGASPVILAYAPLEGLGAFAKAFRGTGMPLHILVDTWIRPDANGSQQPYCGYRVDLDAPYGHRVAHIEPDFARHENFVIFDDTRRTGRHLQEAWEFLSSSNSAIPDARWRVIDNAGPSLI